LRHNIRHLVVNYTYQQALGRSEKPQKSFSLHLARLNEQGKTIVYFDESSFNLWMRSRKTWSNPKSPVRWVHNKFRGSGVTVYGAISAQLTSPLFMMGKTTNKEYVLQFLNLIRTKIADFDEKVYIVLDNHPSHHTKDVCERAKLLNLELMFLPPYSPELNSIESLWSVVKRRVKRQLALNKQINLS
jgi:hypothetical protein